ncbi:MAG: hypothetical protein JWQ54_2213 [Mucilaginibacter sp.]|nr:hypothetical protein [Mucilaginibacter sp.]
MIEKKPPLNLFKGGFIGIVGMAGFEPAASTSQMWRDTGLRYIPKILLSAANIVFLLVLNW